MPISNLQHSQRFLYLDGLRAVAALMVMFHHFYKIIYPNMNTAFLDILFDGCRFGVQIFFVLSGFVIAYSIRNLQPSFSSARQFLLRRSLRLDPPYWIALCFTVMIPILTSHLLKHSYKMDYAVLFANLAYLQDFLGYDRPLAVSWTLCLELQFYVVFILFITLIRNSNLRIVVFLTLYGLSLIQNGFPYVDFPGLFLPYWYSFAIGCMAAWLLLRQIDEKIFWGYLLLMIPQLNDGMVVATFLTTLSIYFAIKFQALSTWLSASFFQYIGKRSYSIYLIHWVVGVKFLDMASRRFSFDSFLLFIIATGITLLCAEIFYRFIEKPFLKYSKTIGSAGAIPLTNP